MTLEIQIQSFIFSFVFGFLFSYIVNLSYHLLFNRNVVVQVISNLFIIVGTCLIYFIGMKAINQAILHLYFYFAVVVGYFIGNLFSIKSRKK